MRPLPEWDVLLRRRSGVHRVDRDINPHCFRRYLFECTFSIPPESMFYKYGFERMKRQGQSLCRGQACNACPANAVPSGDRRACICTWGHESAQEAAGDDGAAEADVVRCTPCREGTFKSSNGGHRCGFCPTGMRIRSLPVADDQACKRFAGCCSWHNRYWSTHDQLIICVRVLQWQRHAFRSRQLVTAVCETCEH